MRLLVIDDDSDLRCMLTRLLGPSGFSVEYAHNGEEGLQRALSEGFDLVILDVMQPDIEGFQILGAIRARSNVPIVVLTAKQDRAERVRGLLAGADDYLPKPFDRDELCARLRAILRRTALSSLRTDTLQVGELQLSLSDRDGTYRGKPLGLTAMECDILERLMRSCGRVVSRDEISHQLYNRAVTAFDRVLDTHIARIRRKLGDGRSMIISVRGVGYQLCHPASVDVSQR